MTSIRPRPPEAGSGRAVDAGKQDARKQDAPRALVVDDDASTRRSLARVLLARGFSVDTAESASAAIDLLRARPVDVVLLDHEMPESPERSVSSGVAAIPLLRRRQPDVEILLLLPAGALAVAEEALRAGAYAVVPTPLPAPESVVPFAERAAERRRLVSRTRALEQQLAEHEQLGEIVASSSAMTDLLRRAGRAAASSSPVLVLGERGTGKDLLARAIHRRSPRARERLARFSCARDPTAIDEGHAIADLEAALAEAEGGTLLVLDLGAASPAVQARLAATLARANEARPRVLATASPEIRELVAGGAFRQDLFYRVASVLLEVPPLRRRRQDVPLLAYHFLGRYAAREAKSIRRVGPEALRELREHPWPGNVAELRAAIEHAVIMARGEVLLPQDLPFARPETAKDGEPHPAVLASPDALDLPYADAKERAVAGFESAYVAARMKRAAGNVSEAARGAGMDRSNFRRLMKRAAGPPKRR
jgi:DNA-binding NtrC family response regulator